MQEVVKSRHHGGLCSLNLLLVAIMMSAGCASYYGGGQRSHEASSVVEFLYPEIAEPLPQTTIPQLNLPLRVGIAFVPSAGANRYGHVTVAETHKAVLLEKVAAEFRELPFVESIEVVPSSYLRPGGGFGNLDQIKRLLSVDVIALVAYDQIQFTNENLLSLTYWTIVGSYIFAGNQNDTETLMEAAVYDIASRSLLFRAPGSSSIEASSTMVEVQGQLRDDASEGFNEAVDHLIPNLKSQLADFQVRLKEQPEIAQITHKPGYSGSGFIEAWFAVALGLTGLFRIRQRLRC